MSDIIERTFKCTGCGKARPCTLKTTQAKAEIEFFDPVEYLKCVLDETNKTAPNWKEVQANDVNKDHEPSINHDGVLAPSYDRVDMQDAFNAGGIGESWENWIKEYDSPI